MDVQKIFEILEIPETKDENAIKTAYRGKLVSVNPEDNPEGFKRLREAYEAGLKYAAQSNEDSAEPKNDDPVSLYLKRLDNTYRSLSRRLDITEWELLLKDELFNDLDLCEDAKWRLFRYLADHYELPVAVWRQLNRVFHIEKEQQKFKEHLPVNFVDFIIWSCSEEADLYQFPYEQLTGNDNADYDEFVHQLQNLTRLSGQEKEYEDRNQWLKELGQKLSFLETLNISHPRFDLEKAKYALSQGLDEDALRQAEVLLSADTDDPRILLDCARIYRRCGKEEEAEGIYRRFLTPEPQKEEDHEPPKRGGNELYTAAFNLADILFHREKYDEAMDFLLTAGRIYNTAEARDMLADCCLRIIEQMTGAQAKETEFTQEEALRLADCYIRAERAAEGVKYFKAHPELLAQDSLNCHRAKAILLLGGGKCRTALTETLAWRGKLAEDQNTSSSDYAQNYIYEARVREEIYKSIKDKQSEEALSHRDEALNALTEAIRLVPENVDILRNKVLFLRTLWESGESEDYCTQAAELCEEMMKLDKNYFWAYYYAQEAYEKLGKAQQVVDYFYEAKRIYDKLPEIYERAATVFQQYRQFKDVGHILQQAEEAGVESPLLKAIKIEFLREDASSEEQILAADEYSRRTLEELENDLEKAEQDPASSDKELKQLKHLMAEAYRQWVLLHDNNDKPEGFKNLDDIERRIHRSLELEDMFSNRYFLGYFYMYEKEDYPKAFRHLKACEKLGTSHWVYRRIALCHEHWKQWDNAIDYYKKGATLAPDSDDYLWRIGWLYRTKYVRTGQQEYYEQALQYLDRQIELFGEKPQDYWDIWWQYSVLHTRNREYEKALKEIDRELETDGQSRNWGHKGDILERLGRSEEAVRMYEKGIKVSWEKHKDYSYGFSQMYDHFSLRRAYVEGLSWFEEKQEKLKTDEQRKKNLGYMKFFQLKLGRWQKAIKIIKDMHGSFSLTNYAYDSWEKEGERIDDLLDAYQYWHTNEQLRSDAQKAASLLMGAGGRRLKENHEGKRKAYMQIGFCYSDYLLDDNSGLFYFKRALWQAIYAGRDTDPDDYRYVLIQIMGCLWRLGRSKEAVVYRTLYMKSIAKDYKECSELGKSVEEMYLAERGGRHSCYRMFELDLFCGEYDKAARRVEQMEKSPWCWHCWCKECTEAWECKGYLALINGQDEEADKYFERAQTCALRNNDDAARERRRLRQKRQKS